VVIDREITGRIKRALADNITKEYKDELIKNKPPANVTSNIDSLPTDTFNEP